MEVTFPHLAYRQTARFYIAGQSLETSESITGVDTIVPTLRGRWRADMSFVLRGEASVLQWRAFLAQMQGRIGTTLVPAMMRYRPRDNAGLSLPGRNLSGIAGAQTWEHFGFQSTEIVRVRTSGYTALRATQMDLTLYNTTGLRPGQFFSIGERLYQVLKHWQPDATTHRIIFDPPLRAAVGNNVKVEIQKPVCKMRMVSETEGLFDMSMDVLPTVQVQFEEAI